MYCFIINPCSGCGRGLRVWKKIEQQLMCEGAEYRAFMAEGPGQASKIAGELTKGRGTGQTIVVVGGGRYLRRGAGRPESGRERDVRLYSGRQQEGSGEEPASSPEFQEMPAQNFLSQTVSLPGLRAAHLWRGFDAPPPVCSERRHGADCSGV